VFASLIARFSYRQKLIELVQVGPRHHDLARRRGLLHCVQRRRRPVIRAAAAHAQQNRLDIIASVVAAHLDGTLHVFDRMFFEQLQDAHVMLHAAMGSVLLLQIRP
jgi:hypothetical protein